MANQTSFNQSSNLTRVLWKHLPIAAQEKLLRLQRGEGTEFFKQKTASPASRWFFLIVAAAWFPALFYLADDYRWRENTVYIFGAATALAAAVFLWMLVNIIRSFLVPLQPHFFITPANFIKTNFSHIEYWEMSQLADVTLQDNYNNGAYIGTTVRFVFGRGAMDLNLTKADAAANLAVQVLEWRARYREAAERGDRQFFEQHGIFPRPATAGGALSPPIQPAAAGFNLPGWALPALVLLGGVPALTFGLMSAAFAANEYHADNRIWANARGSTRAIDFRSYLQNKRNTLHRAEAEQKLAELHDAAGRNYTARYQAKADPKAAAAVLQLLEYVKQTPDATIPIVFERHNDLPADLAEQLKREFKVKNILPVGDTFSDTNLAARETAIASAVERAFKTLIPEDVLSFQSAGGAAASDPTKPAMIIVYHIKSGDDVYYKNSEEFLSDAERTYYPSIIIEWECRLRPANNAAPYQFQLVSEPSEKLSYFTYGEKELKDSAQMSIYSSMTASAFDDFSKSLERQFGLESETAGQPVMTAEPTPKKPKKRR